ncbi:helix-turn-helix domain-containing protein [Alkaliphilus sp. B6464]|uniref:helix-turn-helix domain-containing protein n=1 Tax=Alkaliphilus sp. B6464 TaxID=2731219 RepID=UPI001BA9DB72|nr:helix-turn-helix domain-containing protein [Alkaliphilus sp. B6464]QUH20415.1 helix-turn-helix domain-containing protein [Alkaliphilus sp. B6464]
MNFSERLRSLRKDLNLTQEELAQKLNKTRSTIAGYETERKQPDYETLKFIADFFDVSIDYLLGRTHDRNPTVRISIEEEPDKCKKSNEIFEDIENLSPESQEELKKLIELYKIRDMQKRNDEISDELTK